MDIPNKRLSPKQTKGRLQRRALEVLSTSPTAKSSSSLRSESTTKSRLFGSSRSLTKSTLSLFNTSTRTNFAFPERYNGGSFSLKGVRRGKIVNEDRVSVLTPETNEFMEESILDGMVGVYDGHAGTTCAEYIQKEMIFELTERFIDEESWSSGEDILHEVFKKLDEEFCDFARRTKDISGTCATVAVFKDKQAIVANIGDCRSVLSRKDGQAVEITRDHRASDVRESARISLAGGRVINGRVVSVDFQTKDVTSMEPARTFGDLDAKLTAGEGVVISTPDISRFNVETGEILITATDGLWDVLSNEDAAKICRDALKKSRGDARFAAKELVAKAVKKKSTDDITVAVMVI